ncbi:hypothetical protein LJC68_07575 [Bacteroidales bacterium OttesenSCG-928-B11]|nr:hypothetical protein [Bacteroidales bacterium OttesenSCG-928-C03]MDL2312720.1 hypothetical protein [Bacteroidales bacterium OttesenSCG-928-B11]MDL2326424.1 hypothetical protein [Bacteroidales bacterium OttesenSCG-928-A14]
MKQLFFLVLLLCKFTLFSQISTKDIYSTDKKQAILDIIEMKDPRVFLEKSKYDGNQ